MMLYLYIGLLSTAIYTFLDVMGGRRPEPVAAAFAGALWAFVLAASAGIFLARFVKAILKAIAEL